LLEYAIRPKIFKTVFAEGNCLDIYRFFHPHHNPRLHNTPLRQLELGELEQAAAELRKSLERAQKRAERQPSPPILSEHYTDIIKAARFVELSLKTLYDAHPGDNKQQLLDLINERSVFAGWETWAALLKEQLVLSSEEEFSEKESIKQVVNK